MAYEVPKKTINGYDRYEVTSALQKAVRRNDPELAMYWALELESVKMFSTALARLRVIAQEDVGVGDMTAVLFAIASLDQCEKWYAAGRGSYRLGLANAIHAMCRAKKSRLADYFQAAIRGRRAAGWKPEMPDVALDKHTLRGKKMGRGVDHFLAEGTKLVPEEERTAQEEGWWQEGGAFWKSGAHDLTEQTDLGLGGGE